MASEQQQYTTGAPAADQKPSVVEQLKITGHEHQPQAESHTHQTTKATSPKGETFLQKVKDMLPGSHSHEHATPTTTPGPTAGTTKHTSTTAYTPTTAGTTEPASTTAQPVHHEGIGEKISHFFKGGHSDVKTGEQKKGEGAVHGVTEYDSLK